jgi:hypothetical protein
MVTLPAKLMTIHPFHFIHLLFLLLTKDHKAMGLHHISKRGRCEGQGGYVAVITSSFHRTKQRVNTSSKGLLSIYVSSSSTEGRAHSHSPDYETSVWKMTSSCTERRIYCQRGDVLMGTSLCRQSEQRVSILWTGGLSGPAVHEKGIDWVNK